MKSGLLLDVVVGEGAAVLQLLASEDETLLIGRNSLLVLDLGLDLVDGVRRLYLQRDCLASESLDKDLHSTSETEHQVKSGLLLDVVVGEGAAVLQLLASEDETLLIGRNSLLVLDLGLDLVDGVRRLYLQRDCLASESLDKDLHSTSETEHQVKSGLLLDVVVGEGAAVLQLLASEDETLLIGRNSLLVLDLGLDLVDGVRRLYLQRDCLASESLDEDLHSTSETEHQVKSGLLLDVVVGEGAAVLQLLASEDETLLIGRNSLLVLDLGLDLVDGVRRLYLQRDCLASESLDKDLHSTSETEHQVKSGLLLDVVVGEGAAVLQLLASEDETLLIGRNSLLVLDLGLDLVDGVRRLYLQRDCLASESLDEDLHSTSETEHQVKSGLLLDVVVGEGAAVLQLLASEDETLLIGRNSLLVLDLGLDLVDGVRRLYLQRDCLASESLDEDLHSTSETEHQVKSGLLLDVVVGEGAAVLQLLASEDETLLIGRNSLLVLNLGLDLVDGVRRLYLQRDCLASESLDEDLHSTSETEHQVKSGLLLDVIVGEGAAVLQLLASEDETLLIGRNSLLVLDLGLDLVDGVRRLYLQRDCLASESLDKDLHSTSETEHQVKSGLLLDVVVGEGAAVLQLLASEDETLLIGRNSLLVLDLGLDLVDGVRRLYLQRDCLASESLDEDLHSTSETEHQVKSGLLLDVVVGEGAAVLQLLASEDETLLIGRNSLLVLNLGLDLVDGVRRLYLQRDCLASESLDEDLHSTSETEHQVKSGLLLDVVVGEGAAVLQLLASEDETLLIGRNSLLVLDLGLDLVDGVRRLYLQRDCLASESLDEDLHSTSETEHQVKSGLLLDVIVGEGAAVLQLLASEDETLLIGRNSLLVLDLGLDLVDGVRRLYLQRDCLASESLDEDLHSTSETEHQVKSGLLLDVVVGEGAAVLQLLASEDETLLIGRNSLLVLDLGLDLVDGVRRLYLQRDCLASESLDEDLHSTSETEHQVKSGLLLDVIVGEGAAVLQLLASEDETLLIGRNSLLVLDLGLDLVDGVRRLYLQRDCLASESLDKDLHSTSETEHQVKSGLLLDVVVGEGAAVLQLLASEDETLLIGRNSLLVLDLGLDLVDGVRRLYLQRDCLASESLDEDLHSTSETEHQVKSGLLLDVVVGEGAAVLQLLASEDETLLIGRNSLLVLDLGLDLVDGVRRLYLQRDCLASESLDKDLHSTSETEHQVKSGLLLDVVVGEGAAVLQLLASEDETLLIGRNSLLVLDLGLDLVDGVRRLYLQRDSLASESLDEDLHSTSETEHQVKSGLLLDVIVGEGAAVLQLLASEDETLLIGRNSLLVLDLGLDLVDGVRRLYLKGDSLASESLDKNLHPHDEALYGSKKKKCGEICRKQIKI